MGFSSGISSEEMNFAGLKWSELDKVLEVNRIKGQSALIWLIKSKKDYK